MCKRSYIHRESNPGAAYTQRRSYPLRHLAFPNTASLSYMYFRPLVNIYDNAIGLSPFPLSPFPTPSFRRTTGHFVHFFPDPY
jgi:hypothetical protein